MLKMSMFLNQRKDVEMDRNNRGKNEKKNLN